MFGVYVFITRYSVVIMKKKQASYHSQTIG